LIFLVRVGSRNGVGSGVGVVSERRSKDIPVECSTIQHHHYSLLAALVRFQPTDIYTLAAGTIPAKPINSLFL
jgi:hypothetical protein